MRDRAGIVGRTAQRITVCWISRSCGLSRGEDFRPSDFAEPESCCPGDLQETGPVAIRYPRGSGGAYRKELSAQLVCVHEQSGSEVTIGYGIMVNQAIDAAEILMHGHPRTGLQGK
ncbi:MAG: hypothetical protein ACLT2F_04555 [Butyricicoccus sp.]